jgi:hypothetical protein
VSARRKDPEPPGTEAAPALLQAVLLPVPEQLLLDCRVMARHLLSSGANVPAGLIARLELLSAVPEHCRELVDVHNRFSRLVAPATPRSLVYIAGEEASRGPFDFLGEVPLVRRMMAVALVSTVTLFCVSLSPMVSGNAEGFSLLANSGYSLALHLVFLVAAASIGACFANLYRVKGYVKDGTFDPVYESSYWIRYVLGLLAGTLVALLIPVETWLAGGEKGGANGMVQAMGKPTLALLGGFSSSAVYRILDRMVTALETVVSGDPRDAATMQGRLWEARISEREAQTRLEAAEQLAVLQERAAGGGAGPALPAPGAGETARGWDEVPVRAEAAAAEETGAAEPPA